ncbi:MAG: hypothetical protein KF744_01265 [Taibaiella sp.]|nr:hypothetical protein [Taibaiella sp.]
MKYLIYSSFLVICVLSACKKKDETVYIDPVLLRNCSFGEGTYWVYEDTATAATDTFRVTGRGTRIATDEPPNPPVSRQIHTVSVSCGSNWQYSYTIQLGEKGGQIIFEYPLKGFGIGAGENAAGETITHGANTFDSVFACTYGHYNIIYFRKKLGIVKMQFAQDTAPKTLVLKTWKIVE